MTSKVDAPKLLSRLVLRGYKSIAECDIELGKMNVLIGANGAGKSNFIGFFRLINRLLDEKLQVSVGVAGGPDALLHFGRKKTEHLSAHLYFGNNGYTFTLVPTQDNRMMFSHEALWRNLYGDYRAESGHFESYAETQKGTAVYGHVVSAMRSWLLLPFPRYEPKRLGQTDPRDQ
ncbi:AAA family ATPase [Pseudomonas sp. MWU13-2105]|uniref:AAA family ATPase n=1 Tax=Pseudomonas sp. MWU13-2105 TaxID=2935074 RepID=UPI0020102BA0|nr:hypothetical protein [Pseudomonas sp. MWU13-2105]